MIHTLIGCFDLLYQSSSSHDRPTDEKAAAAASSSSSAVIGRVPLNWQSNVVPSATHAAQSSPIVVGESFVEKKRNYEKSLVAAQSMNQTPSQRQVWLQLLRKLIKQQGFYGKVFAFQQQQLQLHQQHQQQLQQFMMRSDPLRTPTDPAADGSSGSATRLSSSSSSVKSVNRHTQMMEVAGMLTIKTIVVYLKYMSCCDSGEGESPWQSVCCRSGSREGSEQRRGTRPFT